MKLVIRSQNKLDLKKYNDIIEIRFIKNNIGYRDGWAIFIDKVIMGAYLEKERALEVLDEIQQLIKNPYIVECNALITKEDADRLKKYLVDNYHGEFILQPPHVEIHPINQNVVLYEMPEV